MPYDRQVLGDYLLLGSLPWGRTIEHVHARKAGSLVALRVLRAEHGRDPVAVEAFVTRGRTALLFRHPNLVRATQVGRQDGRYFVATEYVAGQTLAELLERCRRTGQRLSLGHVAAIAQAIASALHQVHGHVRPVHPHPGDVLIGYDGVVRLLSSEIPTEGVPAYVAPEQVRGQEAGAVADQFVLAAMTFEMLTLEPAFAGENEFQSLEKVRRAEVPPPSLWNDRVPTELDEIVRRAAAREPDKRYPDAAAMVKAFADLQKGFKFGTVDLADLLARTFPDEVRAEGEARRATEPPDGQPLRSRVMRGPRALHLEPIFWLGIVVMAAGAFWLAAGY